MNGPRFLVVDDKRDLAKGIALALKPLSDDIAVAHSAEQALAMASKRPVDVLLSDIRMPGMGGVALLKRMRTSMPRCRVILFTAYGDVEAAVEAMQLGAYHYLTKPFGTAELLLVAKRALKELQTEDEVLRLRAELTEKQSFCGIYGRDQRMLAVFDALRLVAPADASVLINGESGTGKELVARAVHSLSPRSGGPFVAFNGSALPESLAESELFGVRKGAFTGAETDRKGLFLEADGGTLFIDELSSMPNSLQGKLLRTLQEKEVLPLGAGKPIPVDVRVVSSTGVDPLALMRDGKLRSDLYYRLSVVRIDLPPLRERVEDIPLLASLILERCQAASASRRQLSAGAVRLLMSHDWPGNVRELQNVLKRAVLMTSSASEIGPADIKLEGHNLDWFVGAEADLDYETAKRRVLEQFQRRYVGEIMARSSGNISAAARVSGLSRPSLHRILKALSMEALEHRAEQPKG